MRSAPAALLLLAAPLLAACGDDGEFVFIGTPGTPVAADFASSEIPIVVAHVDGDAADRHFIVDTGAPFTVLDDLAFPDTPAVPRTIDLQAFALEFPEERAAELDAFGGGQSGVRIDGVIGASLMSHFSLSLDYQGSRLWLEDVFDPATRPGDVAVGDTVDLPFRLAGGGAFPLGGSCGKLVCATMYPPATRILMQATFDGEATPSWIIVDSGASAVVLDASAYDALPIDAARPRLDGVTVATFEGLVTTFYTRLGHLALGTGPTATEASVPALVMPEGNDLFASMQLEVGAPVKALVGGTFLRHYLASVDYPERALRLARYTSQAHISAREFVGPGFTMHMDDLGRWVVDDVYADHDAAAQGIVAGDVVVALNGQPLQDEPDLLVAALENAFDPGDSIEFDIRHGGVTQRVVVLVEDLLPEYPSP